MNLKVTQKDIKKYVLDIMLDPNDEQIILMQKELLIIFETLDKSSAIDINGVEPMNWVGDFEHNLRPDTIEEILTQKEILANAPKVKGDFIVINNKKENND
ncbi:Asp-tRNA(Asn)/Glu-tRNA(Gln) amidotransferase subunit GatC [Spiroplasma endosymbiont of Amphibalanus improvisus]|uniref:Asp-tRNA(Asn)/Glu-tRNA(Gln) amidotransferase subunit GatC n=1 Tax=Spiroplasma endosymbiont of Amphibalanus improvisus TaxID=3066327 RepID=UPI00313A92DE